MKIITLTAENVKRLTAVEITPSGSIVQVTGKNGSGKSSVLDAIYYALAGGKALPRTPVRRGAETATIKLDLGEIKVTRKFTAAGGTSLAVESAAGARYSSPQRMLDELVGAISFDPLEFARLDPKDQFDQLRAIAKVDVDLDVLAGKNKTDFERRTEINKAAKAARAQADGLRVPDGLPADAPDAKALLDRLQEAHTHNAAVARQQEAARAAADQAKAMAKQVEQMKLQLEELQEAIVEGEKKIDEASRRANTPTEAPIDTADIRAQIDAVEKIKVGLQARDRKAQLVAEADRLEAQAKELTDAIEARNKAKDDALAAATMPVEGLSLGEGIVLFDGLPFDQASSAAQLRTSVAIAMAANPKLRVLRVKDGGLLDDDGMQMLKGMADAADYQVWIETVHASGPVAIEMVDGHAKADDKTPIEQAAEAST